MQMKAEFFKALGEPIRLKIIKYLLDRKECSCICHLSSYLKRDQSVVFRHMQILKDAGIVQTRKEARFLFCCLKDKKKIKKILED
ncbi:MAG: metalloregulator ArsR/SmtB family transcription factor [Nanoarchaeota archaeon]